MIKKYLGIQFLLLPVFFATFFILEASEFIGVLLGYILSFLFVFTSLYFVDKFWLADDRLFIKIYFILIPIRFITVLVPFGIILALTNISEIYFTVSFIISYLFHSVTETIFIHKILQKRSKTS